jgi:hypothetical protein
MFVCQRKRLSAAGQADPISEPQRSRATTTPGLARPEHQRAGGFATAELHHYWGRDLLDSWKERVRFELGFEQMPVNWGSEALY